MSLKYIYGTNKRKLLDRAFEDIQEEVNKRDNTTVFIISNQKEELEKQIRKFGIIDKELKLKFLSIEDLCRIVFKQTEHKNKKVLNDYNKQILLSTLVCNNEDLLEFYEVSDSMDTVKIFSNTIKYLKEETLKVEDLRIILNNIEDSITKNKLLDIINIYDKYESTKGHLYLDKEDIISISTENINKISTLSGSKVFFIGIEQLSKLEEKLFGHILNKSKGTTIVLNTDTVDREASLNSAHFYKIDLLVKQITDICKKNNISIKDSVEVKSYNKFSDIDHLREYLYKYPFKKYSDKTNYLYINEYDSAYSEIENVVLNILLLNKKGVDFQDIKVIIPQLDKYSTLIKATFGKYKIPHCISSNEKINSNPIIKMILALSEIYKNDFLSKDVVKYLKYNTHFNAEEISLLSELLYIQADSKISNSNDVLTFFDNTDNIDLLTMFREEIKTLNSLFISLEQTNNGFDKASLLFDFIKDVYLGKDFNLEADEINISKNDIEAWNCISTILSSISVMFEDEDISTLRFLEIVSFSLNNLVSESKELEIGKVKVVDLKNGFSESDYVFILNMNEGSISLKDEEEILFNTIDKTILSRFNINLSNVQETIVLKEQYNIFKLLTSANERLYLSTPLSDFTEESISESSIITRLKQIFSIISALDMIDLRDRKLLNQLSSEQKIWLNSVKLAEKIHSLNTEIAKENLKKISTVSNYNNFIDTLERSLTFTNSAECIEKDKLKELYFDDSFSVSKMERFNNCPFSYFLEYGLRIKPLERNIPDYRHLGIFIHEIVEKFGKRLTKNNITWDSVTVDYISQEVDEITNYILNKNSLHTLESTNQSKKHVERLKSIAIQSLIAISKHIGNSFFEPIGHEITFGDNSTYPPIIIKLDSGKRVKLRGQIDRADKYVINNKTYIRIIDYKTGDNTLNYSDIYNGLQLQLITYLDAIISNEAKNVNEILPAGVFYMKLDKPIIKANPYDSESSIEEAILKEMRMKGVFLNEDNIPHYMDKDVYDGNSKSSLNISARFKTDGTLMKSTPGICSKDFDIVVTFTKETIKKTITDMLDGNISIEPIIKGQFKPCNYCKYKLVCLFDETLDENNYKIIRTLKPADALQKIREAVIDKDE